MQVAVTAAARGLGTLALVLASVTWTPAQAARPTTPERAAAKLLKAGKAAEAATLLDRAAAEGGADAPVLQLGAASAWLAAGESDRASTSARTLKDDTGAPFSVRVAADRLLDGLYWLGQLEVGLSEARDALAAWKASDAMLSERVAAAAGSGPAAAKKAAALERSVKATRRQLAELTGADDPVVGELDKLLEAFAAERKSLRALKGIKRSLAKADRPRVAAVKKLERAVTGLERAIAAGRKALVKAGSSGRKLAKAVGTVTDRAVRPMAAVAKANAAVLGASDKVEASLAEHARLQAAADALIETSELLLGAGG